MPQQQNIQLIPVGGSGAAMTPIRLTMPARRVEIAEDAGGLNGLQYQIAQPGAPTPNAATPGGTVGAAFATVTPNFYPLVVGNPMNFGADGAPLGSGPQDQPGAGLSPTFGTIVAYVRSAAAAGTTVRVTEFI